MPKVLIPPPYRGPTHGEGEVTVTATTIKECVDIVDGRFPGFGSLIYTATGDVADFVRFFVNDELVSVNVLNTTVGPDDEVKVLAAIAGG